MFNSMKSQYSSISKGCANLFSYIKPFGYKVLPNFSNWGPHFLSRMIEYESNTTNLIGLGTNIMETLLLIIILVDLLTFSGINLIFSQCFNLFGFLLSKHLFVTFKWITQWLYIINSTNLF